MATPLENMTNGKLAKEWTARRAKKSETMDAVYSLAENGHERWSDIVARLGDSDPAVQAHRAADRLAFAAELEAIHRIGNHGYTTGVQYLANSPRYIRVKVQKETSTLSLGLRVTKVSGY